MLVFPEDTKEYIESEIANYTDMEVKVLGTCCVKLNKQKATLLVNKRRKLKEGENEDELLMEMSSKFYIIIFYLIIYFISLLLFYALDRGPFKYYVIKEVGHNSCS